MAFEPYAALILIAALFGLGFYSGLDDKAKPVFLRCVEIALWICAIGVTLHFYNVWSAPGDCNSSGHAFDYDLWKCGNADHYPYRDVPATAHASFWFACAVSALAVLFSVFRRLRTHVS